MSEPTNQELAQIVKNKWPGAPYPCEDYFIRGYRMAHDQLTAERDTLTKELAAARAEIKEQAAAITVGLSRMNDACEIYKSLAAELAAALEFYAKAEYCQVGKNLDGTPYGEFLKTGDQTTAREALAKYEGQKING